MATVPDQKHEQQREANLNPVDLRKSTDCCIANKLWKKEQIYKYRT